MKYDVSYKALVPLCCELNDKHKNTQSTSFQEHVLTCKPRIKILCGITDEPYI